MTTDWQRATNPKALTGKERSQRSGDVWGPVRRSASAPPRESPAPRRSRPWPPRSPWPASAGTPYLGASCPGPPRPPPRPWPALSVSVFLEFDSGVERRTCVFQHAWNLQLDFQIRTARCTLLSGDSPPPLESVEHENDNILSRSVPAPCSQRSQPENRCSRSLTGDTLSGQVFCPDLLPGAPSIHANWI